MRDTIYVILWTFIAVIAAIDTYFCVQFPSSLMELEQNPVGSWLLSLAGVPALVSVKFFGTSVVLGILLGLRRHWAGMKVIAGMAFLHLLLLLYLVAY